MQEEIFEAIDLCEKQEVRINLEHDPLRIDSIVFRNSIMYANDGE
jgi:hypothetical protein